MFGKIHVTGPEKHPLYRALTETAPPSVEEDPLRERLAGYGLPPAAPGEVLWNFEKFLVDRRGRVVGRFSSLVTPDAEALVAALDHELTTGAAVEPQD
jgi:glutathione peroxidase